MFSANFMPSALTDTLLTVDPKQKKCISVLYNFGQLP